MVSQHSPMKAMGAIPGFLAPSSWTFWVEAIEPSDTIADVAPLLPRRRFQPRCLKQFKS